MQIIYKAAVIINKFNPKMNTLIHKINNLYNQQIQQNQRDDNVISLNSQIECQMKEIDKHLDSSFDNINNFIDSIFISDSPISQFNHSKLELPFPKINLFQLIGQSQFQSNIIQQLKPLINLKIKNQLQQKVQQDQECQQSLIQPQSQLQQQIISQSQFNLKKFNYQIIKDNSIKSDQYCYSIAFNKDCSNVAVACEKQIKIYEFKQGMLKFIEILNEYQYEVYTLNFMKKSHQFISGDGGGSIMIWSNNNNNQWNCTQTIREHSKWIHCLIINSNEDLFISSSGDKTIKFWIKQKEWICQQTITDHTDQVYQLSLNEQQNKVISCGLDQFILVIEYQEHNRKWIVRQNIQFDCYGFRLCFINDNVFTFQPQYGNLMYVYEMNNISKQFTKTKDIIVKGGVYDYQDLFPQQFIKQKQLLVDKHDQFINLIRKKDNDEFKLEQSIQFGSIYIYGQMSDDGEYLITWDQSSEEIQIRKYIEECELLIQKI